MHARSWIIYVSIATLGVLLWVSMRYDIGGVAAREIGALIWRPVVSITGTCLDPFVSWYQHGTQIAQLHNSIAALESECMNLRAEVIKQQARDDMYEHTHEIITFEQRYNHPTAQLVHIIDRVITPVTHYILVDAGSRHGIMPGMIAIYKNCLIGRVQEIYAWYSKVALITDVSCKIAAFCPRTKATGIHEGCCAAATTINHMSHLQTVSVGDLMLSSGQGTIFPRGFGIGKVISVTCPGLLQEVCVQPLIDSASIEYCYLISRAEL